MTDSKTRAVYQPLKRFPWFLVQPQLSLQWRQERLTHPYLKTYTYKFSSYFYFIFLPI